MPKRDGYHDCRRAEAEWQRSLRSYEVPIKSDAGSGIEKQLLSQDQDLANSESLISQLETICKQSSNLTPETINIKETRSILGTHRLQVGKTILKLRQLK